MGDETTAPKSDFRTILLTGFVSLVVGVGSGLLIVYLTEKRPKLTYDITTQEVFPGRQNNVGIFALRISNDGKQEIEQLLCLLRFSQGEITERSVAGIPESARNVGGSDREIEVTVPFLNPGEQFSVHVLLANVSPPLTRPSIDVRGKGVLGRAAQRDARSRNPFTELLSVAIAAIATITTFAMFTSRLGGGRLTVRMLKDILNPTSHSGDQRDTVAFALDTKGLLEDAQVIREWPRDITYWAASDVLCSRWLRSTDLAEIKKALGALSLLLDYAAIADESRRIVLLNMAKLALASGDRDLAEKYLTSARKTKDVIVAKRIKADPNLASMIAPDVV